MWKFIALKASCQNVKTKMMIYRFIFKPLLLLLKSTDMMERVWYKYVGVEVLSQQFNRTNWRKHILFFWKKMLWSILFFSVLSIPALSISFNLFIKKGLLKSVFNQTLFFLFFISGINNQISQYFLNRACLFEESSFHYHWVYSLISISTMRKEGHLAAF